MEFVIVTGLSGAGKTRAMHAMEDIGFFCVDNLPPALIPVFYDLCGPVGRFPQPGRRGDGYPGRGIVQVFFHGHGIFKGGTKSLIRSCFWTPPTGCW